MYYCFTSHQILISVYVCTLHRNVHTYPLPSITAKISLIHHTNYRRMMYSYWHVPIFLPSKYVHYIAVCNDAVSFQWYFRTSTKKHRWKISRGLIEWYKTTDWLAMAYLSIPLSLLFVSCEEYQMFRNIFQSLLSCLRSIRTT